MKTEQTIRYWLNKLEEPYRSQALKNVERKNDLRIDVETTTSLFLALSESFVWVDSHEGYTYWKKKSNQLKRKRL